MNCKFLFSKFHFSNSLSGSAICSFNLSSIHSAMSGPFLMNDDEHGAISGTAPPMESLHPGRCPEERASDSDLVFIRSHSQMEKHVSGIYLFWKIEERKGLSGSIFLYVFRAYENSLNVRGYLKLMPTKCIVIKSEKNTTKRFARFVLDWLRQMFDRINKSLVHFKLFVIDSSSRFGFNFHQFKSISHRLSCAGNWIASSD